MTEDPERRIADLERGLTLPDAEAGSALSTPPRSGLLLGWIALCLLIAALIVGGGVILAGHSRQTVPGVPVAADPPSTAPRPSSRPTVEPTAEPTMAPPVLPEIPVPPQGPTAAGGTISVSGIDRTETIACDGRVVTVSGVDNTVVITGRCERVDVSGVRNSVRIDEAAEIVVSGLDNDVVYLYGDPMLDQSGLRNQVARG